MDSDAAEDDDEEVSDVLGEAHITAEDENTGASDDERDMSAAQHSDTSNPFQPTSNDQDFAHQETSQTPDSFRTLTPDLNIERTQGEWDSLIKKTTRKWMIRKAGIIASGVDVTTEIEPDFPEYQFRVDMCMEAAKQLEKQRGTEENS